MGKYAEVAVSGFKNSPSGVDIFDYCIPDKYAGRVRIGMRVIVPFGSRHIEGYVININDETSLNLNRIKPIEEVPDTYSIFSKNNISLAKWMSIKYMCSLGEALQCIIPSGMIIKESRNVVLNPLADLSHLNDHGMMIYDFLKGYGGEASLQKLQKSFSFNVLKEVKSLSENGIISISYNMDSGVKDSFIRAVDLNADIGDISAIVSGMETKKRSQNQALLLKAVAGMKRPVPETKLVNDMGFSKSTIKTLADKNIIKYVDINKLRDPYGGVEFRKQAGPELTLEQREVLDRIKKGYSEGQHNFLIHGITGSGKTEIYMRVIEYMIKQGRQSIMLVPEISLTPQTIERFKGRFNNVAVIHSRLSPGERYDEWKRIINGEVDVVVGARSAVFAPLKNIGAIIIDEEHESSYKSDMTPKYLTGEVARKRCEIEDALLILGSATPSIDTYYNAKRGGYVICEMKHRVDDRKLPEIELVDMREEIISGNRSIFSRKLYNEIKKALSGNHQVILFLNRRGFSTFVSCRKCGLVMKCPRCDVSLTYHYDNNMLSCHYCGYEVRTPDVCPSCGSRYIKYFGIGTQRIESEVKKYFPSVRVLRMDFDSTTKKGSHDRLYNTFKNHEADILVGTQMISKGLDFPGVTLVGIIAADQSLNIPDFRASERTFQLITQVSGRAGRGEYEGRVVVQTYTPEHYSIIAALHQDYGEFYDKEIQIRKSFKYPPFSDLINIVAASKTSKEAEDLLVSIVENIKKTGDLQDIDILGPSPAPISKINNYYRWQTILKGNIKEVQKNEIVNTVNKIYVRNRGVRLNIDMNPVSML